MPFYSVSIGVDYVKSEYFKHTLFASDEEHLDELVLSMSVEDVIERGCEDGSTEGGYTDEAEAILRANVDDRKRVLELEHPDTLRSTYLLSRLLRLS